MTKSTRKYLKMMMCSGLLCSSFAGFSANWKQLEDSNPAVYSTVQEALQEDGQHVALWGYSAQSYRDFDEVLRATVAAIPSKGSDGDIHLWYDGDPLPKIDGDANVATLTQSVAKCFRDRGRSVVVHAINPYDPPSFVDQRYKVVLPTLFNEKNGKQETDWSVIPGFYLGGPNKMGLVIAAGGGDVTERGVRDALFYGVEVHRIEADAK